MSTPQTDAHHTLQENIFINFTKLVDHDFDMARQWIIDHQNNEHIDNATLIKCENYLDEEEKLEQELQDTEFDLLLTKHK